MPIPAPRSATDPVTYTHRQRPGEHARRAFFLLSSVLCHRGPALGLRWYHNPENAFENVEADWGLAFDITIELHRQRRISLELDM